MNPNDSALTKEERDCLRMWFRQAIAQVEMEEATAAILKDRAFFEGTDVSHRSSVPRRKAVRTRNVSHGKGVLV
jgi:hypothetical protein